MIIYRNMVYVFDNARFSQAIIDIREGLTWDELSDLMGISKSTLNNWANGNWSKDFPHPHMSNFLFVCNELNLNPIDFFMLVDKD